MRIKRFFVISCIATLVTFALAGCGKTVSFRDIPEEYVKEMEYHDGFTILQLTDIHWNGSTQIGDDTYGSRGYLKKVIDEAKSHAGKIDLIEITGDTFMLTNKRAVTEFIDFMDEMDVPYAIGWGNHDRECTYNPNWISKQFLEAPNSLYTEVDNDDVHERANYVIELKSGSEVAWQIFNLDSGASFRNGAGDLGLTYDYLRDDQFEWMSYMHERTGNNPPSLCYYHIVQDDQKKVCDAIANGELDIKFSFFKLEGLAPSDYCVSTEDIFLQNNVKGAFAGHDHSNDFTYTLPSGIVYGLGVKSGIELYSGHVTAKDIKKAGLNCEEFDLLGASLVTLQDTEGNFKLEHLYLNERDEGDFVMWVEY